jgi:hypothetical protein
LRQIEALKAAACAWKDKDHPELKQARPSGCANSAKKPSAGLKERPPAKSRRSFSTPASSSTPSTERETGANFCST